MTLSLFELVAAAPVPLESLSPSLPVRPAVVALGSTSFSFPDVTKGSAVAEELVPEVTVSWAAPSADFFVLFPAVSAEFFLLISASPIFFSTTDDEVVTAEDESPGCSFESFALTSALRGPLSPFAW